MTRASLACEGGASLFFPLPPARARCTSVIERSRTYGISRRSSFTTDRWGLFLPVLDDVFQNENTRKPWKVAKLFSQQVYNEYTNERSFRVEDASFPEWDVLQKEINR